VARSGQEDRIEVILPDETVEMNVGEGDTGTRAPVPEQAVLDMARPQRLAQERIVLQVDHAHREVIARAPVGVDPLQFFDRDRAPRCTRLRLLSYHGDTSFGSDLPP
jgi:hypothetical protein